MSGSKHPVIKHRFDKSFECAKYAQDSFVQNEIQYLEWPYLTVNLKSFISLNIAAAAMWSEGDYDSAHLLMQHSRSKSYTSLP